MHTVKSLIGDLRRIGVREGDTLLVHSSIRSVGEVEGRGDAILDALLAAVGPEGLLVLPTLTYARSDKPGKDPFFVVDSTPAQIGTLPNLFLQRPGVIRSWHPTHSVAALGRDAAEFTAGHEKFDSPAARTSPWGKLIDRHARIMFIGADIGCNTFLHGVEEQSGIPGVLTDEKEQLYTVTPAGERILVPSRRHIGHHSHYYTKVRQLFTDAGILVVDRFGDARCQMITDAAEAARLVTPLLLADPGFFTHE